MRLHTSYLMFHPLLLHCRYLMGEFVKNPIACLTLASYLITNTGGVVFLSVAAVCCYMHAPPASVCCTVHEQQPAKCR
jgi:hypothetical protein